MPKPDFFNTWVFHKVLLLKNSLRAHFCRKRLVLAATANSKTCKDSLERALHFLFSYARTYNAPYALRLRETSETRIWPPAASKNRSSTKFGWCENTLKATFSYLIVDTIRPTVRPLIASEKTTFFLRTCLFHKVLLLNSLRAHFGRNPLVLAATANSKTREDSLERALHFLFSYAHTYDAPYALHGARRRKHVYDRHPRGKNRTSKILFWRESRSQGLLFLFSILFLEGHQF